MRKINSHFALGLNLHQDNKGLNPAPFPGRDPIRWGIWFQRQNGKVWMYVGKPNTTVARKVNNLLTYATGPIAIREFDRKNVIASMTGYCPCNPRCSSSSPVLLQYYRPYSASAPVVWRLNSGMAELTFEKKTRIIYAPSGLNRYHLEDYKAWLEKQNEFLRSLTSIS